MLSIPNEPSLIKHTVYLADAHLSTPSLKFTLVDIWALAIPVFELPGSCRAWKLAFRASDGSSGHTYRARANALVESLWRISFQLLTWSSLIGFEGVFAYTCLG